MEERPTCRVYIEVFTCRAIFCHLEDSRSHGNEREGERARGQGARPPPLGASPDLESNQDSLGITLHRPKGSRITVQSMSV